MIDAALNEQNLWPITVDMGTSEEEGERNLEFFNDKNCLGCEHSSQKEGFKHVRKARAILIGVADLHNSYPRRVIPTNLIV